MKPKPKTVSFSLDSGKTITLETGLLAKQASGAVVARMGDTMVLCTTVISTSVKPGQSYFPLMVDYRENFASGGRIPGGFIKREGRSNDKEILTSRLVDRAIRPLFPDGFRNEIQVIVSVISAGDEHDGDMLAGVGASAALLIGGAPFGGPMAEVRIGRVKGNFVVNPTLQQMEGSDFNLVVAGTSEAILMVEGEMDEVSEKDVIDSLEVAHEVIIKLCALQEELLSLCPTPEPLRYRCDVPDQKLVDTVESLIGARLAAHIRAPYEKSSFYGGLSDFRTEAIQALATDEEGTPTRGDVANAVAKVSKRHMRELVLAEGRRIDGRSSTEVRPIWCSAGYLPRVHGSAIFTRGETQVMASVTLGTSRDQQEVDQVFSKQEKRFYLHYAFPPFSTGEVKFLRGASRREIGHGYLAERALQAMMPEEDEFPYTVRINADVLESNGSSSMASVCSGSMALMDAGVPIPKPVSGVAMGMISDGSRNVILTDILGTEDHLGDMDFKVTGTRDGITACQMDIKIAGLSQELMMEAMEQAREARLHILDLMDMEIDEARADLSPYAPRLTQIVIDAEFIGAVIGPQGKIIRGIQSETDTVIEIDERDNKGYVTIASPTGEGADAAIKIIRGLVAVPEVGENYEGIVKSVNRLGAIVEIMPGKEGMVHISEMMHGYVKNPADIFKVGEKVKVQVLEIGERGKLRLSRKALLPPPKPGEEFRRPRRSGGPPRSGFRRGRPPRRPGRGGNAPSNRRRA